MLTILSDMMLTATRQDQHDKHTPPRWDAPSHWRKPEAPLLRKKSWRGDYDD